MTDLNLDLTYVIRADAIFFVLDRLNQTGRVGADEVVEEILRQHPGLDRATAEHIDRRVAAHWGLGGLDLREAPEHFRHRGVRAWYPVDRNGRLERVPVEDLTPSEVDAIRQELLRQGEADLGRAERWSAIRNRA